MSFKNYLQLLKSRIQIRSALPMRLLPSASPNMQLILKRYWNGFRGGIEKLFVLSDHSSLRAPRAVLRFSLVFFVLLFFWAAFFHIDQVVKAQGQVIADAKTQIVQSADGGILIEMRVKEGDIVTRGQVIATLEKERATASYSESLGKVTALRMTTARLQAELSGKKLVYEKELVEKYPNLVETQMNLFNKRQQSYREQLAVLEDNVRLAEQELAMNLPLEKMGDVSKADILKIRRALNEARGALTNQKNKYFQDASAELNKASEDLNAQEQVLADRSKLLEQTNLIAPTDGIVKSIRVTTLGGVVRQGEEILQILPTESDLVIEAKVKPSDMAFMKVGLPAKVKLDAYDYSIFGTMRGTVTYISADALTEETKTGTLTYYRVKVNIGEKDFLGTKAQEIEVRPGMTATIDILTGERTILSYIMKPITRTFSGALGER